MKFEDERARENEEFSELINEVKNLPEPLLPSGFSDVLFRGVYADAARNKRRMILRQFSLAAAASVLIAVVWLSGAFEMRVDSDDDAVYSDMLHFDAVVTADAEVVEEGFDVAMGIDAVVGGFAPFAMGEAEAVAPRMGRVVSDESGWDYEWDSGWLDDDIETAAALPSSVDEDFPEEDGLAPQTWVVPEVFVADADEADDEIFFGREGLRDAEPWSGGELSEEREPRFGGGDIAVATDFAPLESPDDSRGFSVDMRIVVTFAVIVFAVAVELIIRFRKRKGDF